MSWIGKLYETYEACAGEVAAPQPPGKLPLLPVSHSLQTAHIEVTLDEKGIFCGAQYLMPDEAVTILPCTEDSASRGAGISPNALYDKLIYIAGDFAKYTGQEKAENYFEAYMQQLKDWCESPYSHIKVKAVYQYLQKKRLIKDLVQEHLLFTDEKGRLTQQWNGDKKVKPTKITETFVRFQVEVMGENTIACNEDKALFTAYETYYAQQKREEKLCYVQGVMLPAAEKHPAKLRWPGDSAKLISANDKAGFTYRGRYTAPEQAVTIGYESSQKAHNALRWLINRQGWRNGDQIVVAWTINGMQPPQVQADTDVLTQGATRVENGIYLGEVYAERLHNAAKSLWHKKLEDRDEVMVMILEAATPGRMSVPYYKEIRGNDFVQRLEYWHETCYWLHHDKWEPSGNGEKGEDSLKPVYYIGAPSLPDILFAAYGPHAGDNLKKRVVQRLLPCITERARLPKDMMQQAVQRALNPHSMEEWEWEKTLSSACALIRKYRYDWEGEKWEVKLEENNARLEENYEEQNDRSFLFGRLLACAHQLEVYACYKLELDKPDGRRETHAQKYYQRFRMHPKKTWGKIMGALQPYISRLHTRDIDFYSPVIDKISKKFVLEQFQLDEPLDETFLLGYSCQMEEFREQKRQRQAEKEAKAEQE